MKMKNLACMIMIVTGISSEYLIGMEDYQQPDFENNHNLAIKDSTSNIANKINSIQTSGKLNDQGNGKIVTTDNLGNKVIQKYQNNQLASSNLATWSNLPSRIVGNASDAIDFMNGLSTLQSIAHQIGIIMAPISDFVSGSKTTITKDAQGNVTTKNVTKPDGSTIQYQYKNGILQTKTEIVQNPETIETTRNLTDGTATIQPQQQAPIKKTTYFKNGKEIGSVALQNVTPNEYTQFKPAVKIDYDLPSAGKAGVRQEIVPDDLQNAEPQINLQTGKVERWKGRPTQDKINKILAANPQPTVVQITIIKNPAYVISNESSTTYYGLNNNKVVVWNSTNQISDLNSPEKGGRLISEKNSNSQVTTKQPTRTESIVTKEFDISSEAYTNLRNILSQCRQTDKSYNGYNIKKINEKIIVTTISTKPLTFVYDEKSNAWSQTK